MRETARRKLPFGDNPGVYTASDAPISAGLRSSPADMATRSLAKSAIRN